MTRKKYEIHNAFLAAPARIDLRIIKAELTKRGIKPLTAYELPSHSDSIMNHLRKAIRICDLFVAVIPEDYTPTVLFEIGLAYGLKKRILLFTSPNLKNIPGNIEETMYFRSEPNNREVIAFALDQILASQEQKTFRPKKQLEEGYPLGNRVDKYLRKLQERTSSLRELELRKLVVEILKESGISTVLQGNVHDPGADLAVWSNDLDAIVGNPLLIEVKSGIRTKKDLDRILHQVEQCRMKSGTKWVLLVLSKTVESIAAISGIPIVGRVLVLTTTELLKSLRTRSFAQVIRELRNKQVHGELK